MLRPVLITPNVADVVTLVEAKLHLRIDFTDDDTLIQSLIYAAVSHLDGYSGILGRPLLNATWQMGFANFNNSPWRLLFADYVTFTSIKYYDLTNTQQTLAGTVYDVLTDEIGPYIVLRYGQSWPNVYTRDDAVTVLWISGYGATAAAVPNDIKVAIKMIVAHWYEYRGMILADKRLENIPFAAMAILQKYMRTKI